ncbi:hypothetical protein FJ872_28085 [Mesorhizobium sp. B2-5-9]|uniref:hypothetical protein n=1 Tax=Mesorhizobium sp. B2-5-9 TaxID=2589921 RepID=UPI0011269D7B|nr:hypothetical protein [Mesorhizobium sp. B2-5-9]TPK03195.1 hypothetical protein FJ872_28085 [Mesorhizobium sp. B2-5-9]
MFQAETRPENQHGARHLDAAFALARRRPDLPTRSRHRRNTSTTTNWQDIGRIGAVTVIRTSLKL